MHRRILLTIAGIGLAISLGAGFLLGAPTAIARPTMADSMGPIEVSGVTIENFGVADGRIFRGAQPRPGEYGQLAALGIRTVIDLRLDAEPWARTAAEHAGLRYVNVPILKQSTPTDEHAAAFLAAVDDPESGLVYVHCAGGRHRTGSMIAVYRMVRNGWSIDQAYDEMLDFDFYTKWGHEGFKTFVYDYAERHAGTLNRA